MTVSHKGPLWGFYILSPSSVQYQILSVIAHSSLKQHLLQRRAQSSIGNDDRYQLFTLPTSSTSHSTRQLRMETTAGSGVGVVRNIIELKVGSGVQGTIGSGAEDHVSKDML